MPDSDLTGLSLLIVEDETLLRKRLAAQLEQLGADVTGAGTLKEAQRWLGDLSFDFVLLDVNLPDGLGTDLLKAKEVPANTGVIVMTKQDGREGDDLCYSQPQSCTKIVARSSVVRASRPP